MAHEECIQDRKMGPLILVFSAIISACVAANPCVQKNTGGETIVCVCNATYCDYLDPISDREISGTAYLLYETTEAGLRLHRTEGKRTTASRAAAKATFTVERATTYQEILGFGAALTDSAALNVMNLSRVATHNLLRAYFGEGGSNYLYLRVPMASCDFSETYYSYDDVKDDVSLKHFSLSQNDIKYKVPIVKAANQLRGQEIKLFASPWSAPYWMKVNGTTKGISYLNEAYYEAWANYFVKYFEEFKQHGVNFWGVNPQNEPSQGQRTPSFIPSMGWTTDQMKKFVGQNLGPTLHKSGFGGLKLMNLDDNRSNLPAFVDAVLADAAAKKYSSGIAVHWYTDNWNSVKSLTKTHESHPDQFLFYTEACVITTLTSQVMGAWTAIGERYMNSMFQALNNWVVGWTDWNMALNEQGGPKNVGDHYTYYGYPASILVNGKADEFYKLSSYYVQAHFSSFITPGSKRVELAVSGDSSLLNVAFLTPEGRIVVVLANLSDEPVTTVITEKGKATISVNIQKRSISTVIYK